MKRIWVSALLLSLLTLGCAKGKPVPWTSVASSWDGSKLVAVGDGTIHTSTDSGATWTKRGPWGYWTSVASSSDGIKLVAVSNGDIAHQDHGNVLVSTDSGVSWSQRSIDERNWNSVASSVDGTKLAVVGNDNQGHSYIYISTDAGVSWTQGNADQQKWVSVASSADGNKLVAVSNGALTDAFGENHGNIFISTDSGISWTQGNNNQGSGNWFSVASSSNGSKLAVFGTACMDGCQSWFLASTDSGFSWTPVGATNQRGKSANDEIADVTFNPANSGAILLNSMTVTFSGAAASSTGFLSGVKLVDPSGNTVPVLSQTPDCNGVGTCSVTFNFGGRLDSGAQTYKVAVNDTLEQVATGGTSVSLYVTINTNTDVTYTDAPSGGLMVNLPAVLQPGNQIFPLNLNSVTYAQGT